MADEPTNNSTVIDPPNPAPETAVAEPPIPSPPIGAVDAATESLLSSVRVLMPKDASPATQRGETEKTEAVKKEEPPKPAPTIVEPQLSQKASEKFSKLETRANNAEAERDALSKERDELRSKIQQLSSASVETETLRQRAEKAEKEREEYAAQLRTVSIERDPAFRAQYDQNISKRQAELKSLALSTGATDVQFNVALETGDEDALQSIRDSLKPNQQRAWDAHLTDIERFKFSRKEAIQNSEQTWRQIEEQRLLESKSNEDRLKASNLRLADASVESLWNEIPGLKDQQAEVRAGVENVLRDAVVNWPKDRLVKELAIGQIRSHVIAAQAEVNRTQLSEIAERDKQIEELRAKLGEQETFIKEHALSFPRGNGAGSENGNGNGNGNNGSLLQSVRVRLPGQ